MDFAREVGQGYGAEWRGVLFRRTYPELQDVIDKALKWYPRIFPTAQYNRSAHCWTFATGEQLFFRHFMDERDYWSYHGHAYPWIGWEELCTWPSEKSYLSMFSCNRSSHPRVPKRVRATANPYGPGHNWVKLRYRLPVSQGRIVGEIVRDAVSRDGSTAPARVAIHGNLHENKVLLSADPGYIDRLRSSASNESQLRAWLYGDWTIVAGGMFDDVWDPAKHVVPNFPLSKIPQGWYVNRSYDHGQSAPFSVGWWAESNGEPLEWNGRTYGGRRGDLYRVAEWYGWYPGRPNEGLRMLAIDIGRGILERERDYGIAGRVAAGPADTQIFDEYERNKSVAGDMKRVGVRWDKADKGPGTRKQGWEQMRKYLKAALNPAREEPGLWILERCQQGFIRTIPVLPRDERDLDDVDDSAEDHVGDEVRYRLRHKNRKVSVGGF